MRSPPHYHQRTIRSAEDRLQAARDVRGARLALTLNDDEERTKEQKDECLLPRERIRMPLREENAALRERVRDLEETNRNLESDLAEAQALIRSLLMPSSSRVAAAEDTRLPSLRSEVENAAPVISEPRTGQQQRDTHSTEEALGKVVNDDIDNGDDSSPSNDGTAANNCMATDKEPKQTEAAVIIQPAESSVKREGSPLGEGGPGRGEHRVPAAVAPFRKLEDQSQGAKTTGTLTPGGKSHESRSPVSLGEDLEQNTLRAQMA